MDKLLAEIKKRFGADALRPASEIDSVAVIPTGCLPLDLALGVGGVPKGRVIEIFGPLSCVAEDTFIQYSVWDKSGKIRKNNKGGTISRLYERFKGEDVTGIKQGRHLMHSDVKYYVMSVDDKNHLRRNEILDVVRTGVKECYRVETEDGQVIEITKDHKFLTQGGYFPLSDLSVGDIVYVHNNTQEKGRKHYPTRPTICVKYHPKAPIKKVTDGKSKKVYVYHRGQTSRLAYEAQLNGLEFYEYIHILNNASKKVINSLKFIPDELHVHHKDENFYNNDPNNLLIINPVEHGRLHALDKHEKGIGNYIAIPVKIKSICLVGDKVTYDIKCAFPNNNYVAAGFVVHNSGKTSLCQSIISVAQSLGGVAVYIDVENALDPTWLQKWGVNLDDLLISQPSGAEIALELVKATIESGAVDVIVLDSVAALVPHQVKSGEVGDTHIALTARLMSMHMGHIASLAAEYNCTVIFINQTRSKIGVMFGDPTTTTGGVALGFTASVRISMWQSGNPIEIIPGKGGTLVKFKVVKNKVAPPFMSAETRLLFSGSFDRGFELLNMATKMGIITGKGVSRSYRDQRFTSSTKLLEMHPTVEDSSNQSYKKNEGKGKEGAIYDLSVGGVHQIAVENEIRERLRFPIIYVKGDNISTD